MDWKSTTAVRVFSPGDPLDPDGGNSPEMDDLTIPQLVSYLQVSFQTADFARVEQILRSWQESLKADIERLFSEDLAVMEVDKVELQARCTALDRALTEEKDRHDAMAADLSELERERSLARAEAEKYVISCDRLGAQIAGLKGDYGTVRGQVKRALKNICQYLETQKDRILEVEKKKQEEERRWQSEIEYWKRKCADLEAQVRQLEEERRNMKSSDTGRFPDGEDRRSRIRAQSLLKVEVGSKTPIGIIDISDSDDDMDVVVDAPKSSMAAEIDQKNVDAGEGDEDGICSKNFPSTKTPKRKSVSRMVTSDSENDEPGDWVPFSKLNQKKSEDVIEEDGGSTRTPKRKCALRVVTSDSEDDDEDNDCIPPSKLKQRRLVDVTEEDGGPISVSDNCFLSYGSMHESVTSPLRRLVSLRERDETRNGPGETSPKDSAPKNHSPSETSSRVLRTRANARRQIDFSDVKGVVADEVRGGKKADTDDASESGSEGESLDEFIVDGTESESRSNDASEEGEGEGAEQSESDVELDDVLAKLRRGKGTKNWEYEADMLSAFGKSPELCMKAVCALYRLQTSEEQSVKQSFVANRRGFSKFDAVRGSMLAEFLTGGNAYGPIKKTVEQLKEYDRKGPEDCYQLATRYSKQLFAVYQNKIDPNFGPS